MDLAVILFLKDALCRILNSDDVYAICNRGVPWDHDPTILVGFVKTKHARLHCFEFLTMRTIPLRAVEMLIADTCPVHSLRFLIRNERAEFAHEPNGGR